MSDESTKKSERLAQARELIKLCKACKVEPAARDECNRADAGKMLERIQNVKGFAAQKDAAQKAGVCRGRHLKGKRKARRGMASR